MKKIATVAFMIAALQTGIEAQVRYKVERLPNSRYYVVSAISDATYINPMNLVSTAQVTLKVPSGGFKVGAIQPFNTRWTLNGRVNSPQENPDFDYVNFGLRDLGTSRLSFKKGETIPLFAFEASGGCEGEVALIDNKTDVLTTRNASKINIGNQMTILGAGGDAWKGNVQGVSKADCFEMTAAEKALSKGKLMIMPNPVRDYLTITFVRNEKDGKEGAISFYDTTGKRIFSEQKQFNDGTNEYHFDLSAFAAGTYQMEIEGLQRNRIVEKVVKIN